MIMKKGKLLSFLMLSAALLSASGVKAQDGLQFKSGDMLFRFSGYGQANYNVTNVDGEKETNAFELSRVILMPQIIITPKLNFFMMIDVATKKSDMLLHEYWGSYTFNDAFSVKVGQYKTHYSIENLMSPTAVGNIFFHDGMAYLAGCGGDPLYGSLVGRDFGVTVSGKFLDAADGHKYLGYAAGVFNGSGINKSENNTQKDVVVKLDYMPTKDVTVSASTYLGTGHALGSDYNKGVVAGDDYSRQRIAAGFEANLKPLYLRSEYLRGWDNKTPAQSAYAELWLHVLPKHNLDVILDYEYFDSNIELKQFTRNYMAGIQWWFHKQCRISSLYQFKDPCSGRISRKWVTQLQLRF